MKFYAVIFILSLLISEIYLLKNRMRIAMDQDTTYPIELIVALNKYHYLMVLKINLLII